MKEGEEKDLAVSAFLLGVPQRTVIGQLVDSCRPLATWEADDKEHERVGRSSERERRKTRPHEHYLPPWSCPGLAQALNCRHAEPPGSWKVT